MWPVAYLLIRACIGWLQFMERSNRAFVNSTLVLAAAGAAHCCLIVYALFLTVHNRAMRYDGYHEGYVDHLPPLVAWSETLAVASFWVWLLAGLATAAVRVVDVDSENLPSGVEDTKISAVNKIMGSPVLRRALGLAQSLSCAVLFIDVLLLCITMAMMEGGISTCEFCTFLIAVVFAIPHAALALGHLHPSVNKSLEAMFPQGMIESAAAEAAAMAPQLCVVLGVADAPGHAYFWQKLVYSCTAVAIVAAVIVSALSPGKNTGAALPPEASQSFSCIWVSVSAAICIILSYPDMNQWSTWVGTALVCGFGMFGYPLWKDEALDWLEPIFTVRSDSYKRLPNHQRQMVRSASWIMGVLCAITGLWDIILHPPTAQTLNIHNDALSAVVSHNLILRWKPSAAVHDANDTLAVIASAMNIPVDHLEVEAEMPEHRLLIFHAMPGKLKEVTLSDLRLNWSQLAHDPKSRSKLAGIVDTSFPALISARTCNTVNRRDKGETVEDDSDKKGSLKTEDAREAYKAACKWWSESIQKYNEAFSKEVSEIRIKKTKFLAQWQAGTNPTEPDLQLSLANLMNRSSETVRIEKTLAAERIAIFETADGLPKSKMELGQAWILSLADTTEVKAKFAENNLDHGFPRFIQLNQCVKWLAQEEPAAKENEDEETKLKRERSRAMHAACKWWVDQLPAQETQLPAEGTQAAETSGEKKTTV
mmetsp:Transcript_45488/g.90079  ORF Transcript_45488/g.90079 Transcript_45488/m.90079 type:complete len:707 (-) Transcript_45488:109-2229(-)